MGDEILKAKVEVSGTEEALTSFGASRQRAVMMAEMLSGSGTDTEVDKILSEAGLGPMQEIRQMTSRYKREIDDIVKTFQTVKNELAQMPSRKPRALGESEREVHRLRQTLNKLYAPVGSRLEQETANAGKAVGRVMDQVLNNIPLVGGLIGLMIMGPMKKQEEEAAAARFIQLFEESTRTISEKAAATDRSAAAKLAHTAHEMTWRFQATEQEILSAVRSFSTMGISAGEIGTDLSGTAGKAAENMFALTVQLERHFELAAGSTAQQAAQFMTEYGMSTSQAADTLLRLNLAGAKSGVGIENFSRTVMQASTSVRHMGVNVNDVISLTQALQKQYEGLGLNKHLAGQLATSGVQQMLGGIRSLDMPTQVLLAERVVGERSLAARYEMLSKLEGDDANQKGMLEKYVKELYGIAQEVAHGDPTLARQWLESKLGFEGARAMVQIGDKLASGLEWDKASAADIGALKNSMKTEEQKTNEFTRGLRDILMGMSDVGSALFNVVTAGIAGLVISIRETLAILSGDRTLASALAEERKKIGPIFPQALEQAVEGLGKIGEASDDINLEGLNLLAKSAKLAFGGAGGAGGDEPTRTVATGRTATIERAGSRPTADPLGDPAGTVLSAGGGGGSSEPAATIGPGGRLSYPGAHIPTGGGGMIDPTAAVPQAAPATPAAPASRGGRRRGVSRRVVQGEAELPVIALDAAITSAMREEASKSGTPNPGSGAPQ